LVGAVGILALVPGLTDLLTGVFGLSQIVWLSGWERVVAPSSGWTELRWGMHQYS
jgi:hypothetical protein